MITGTRIHTWLYGRPVGADEAGNRYYEDKRGPRGGDRARRWVMYNGEREASRIPSRWHAWLHYTTDTPIDERSYHWEREHSANQTGSELAYAPPGDDRRGGARAPATGDYEAWRPV